MRLNGKILQKAAVAVCENDAQVLNMDTVRFRWSALAGLATLIVGPISFSYPFLVAWNHAGIGTSLSAWLLLDLAVALLIGCSGFWPLRFRGSTKGLMLLFYVPTMAFALFAWPYAWCTLCDF
ncbi:MAG: hypothetical protein WC804_12700 [Sphingomonas sp.]|uniref:hypothetical protein n=1 Tax=Sphingomonas sp. TaxID=28214 RepID=UPI0035635446